MADYAEMYKKLFNAQTDVIKILQEAQQEVEKIYMDCSEETQEENKNPN